MNKYRKNLVRVLARIQNCWEHHQDGSDLLKSKTSHLFRLIFNDLEKAIIGDANKKFTESSLELEEEEELKWVTDDYSFKKIVKEVERADKEEADAQSKEIEKLKKKIKGLEGSIEDCYKPWKRDAKKYLEILERHKICPDCESVDKVCDCPFG